MTKCKHDLSKPNYMGLTVCNKCYGIYTTAEEFNKQLKRVMKRG